MPKQRTVPNDPDEVSRYTLNMSAGHQLALAKLAKAHKLSQREILETLLDNVDVQKMGPIFEQMRESKVAEREQKKDLIKKLSRLNADELRALEKLAAKQGALL
jgi:hypothetical protein